MNILHYIIIFLLGAISGSFLNSLIYRLAANLPLGGRSYCPHCRTMVLFRDLLPVLSFVILRARCRFCRQKISWQYFVMEIFAGILFVLVYLHHGALNFWLLRDCFFVSVLLFVMVFDFKYYLILDKIVYPSIIIAAGFNLGLGVKFEDLLSGLFIGSGFFLLLYLISGGRGIGWGDVKLGLLIGIILGWQMTIMAILLAYIGGAFVAVVLLVTKRKKWADKMPLGAFLALAGIIVLLFGETIINLYL